MRGRKPKPTASQIAAGDPRKLGIRKLKAKLEAEPKAARGLPPPPKHLKGLALSAWKFWVEELSAMGIDRRPDGMMLEGACFNYAAAIQAESIIAKEGPTVERWTPLYFLKKKELRELRRAILIRADAGCDTRDDKAAAELLVKEIEELKSFLSVKAHPAVQIARQRWTLVKGFCSEFGLSPVSRTRLSVEKKDEGDVDLMAALSAPREPKPAIN
jgi:P27 family predicted phage terminase small subunit